MITLEKTQLPMEEKEFQELLTQGLIKQCPSDEEEICRMLGLPIRPDLGVPRFEIDKSVIINLLQKAKCSPEQSSTTLLCRKDKHLANEYFQDIHVTKSGIYINLLHEALITEIGFYFESQNPHGLEKSLSSSQVAHTNKNLPVKVPFFKTHWSHNKDAYEYTDLNMNHFKQWLAQHFSHHNIHYEVQKMLTECLEELNRDNFFSKSVNYVETSTAFSLIEQQFSLPQSGHSEIKSSSILKNTGFYASVTLKGPSENSSEEMNYTNTPN